MHLSRSSSRIVMLTFGIRIMANLPDRKDGQRRVDHWDQSGHFYLAESGHFYLGITSLLRIMYIMLNYELRRLPRCRTDVFRASKTTIELGPGKVHGYCRASPN